MSYADYRTGGARRTSVPVRDPSAYDSFAGAQAPPPPPNSSSRSHSTPSAPPPNPIHQSHHPVVPAPTNASMFMTNLTGRPDNPYSTNAYASSRGGPLTGGASASAAPPGAHGGGPEFYPSARAKGNRQGRIKDTIKNTMAQAKQDNWKVVAIKATSHDIAPPKSKHVRVIMQGLQWGGSITNRESPAGGIFYHMRKRMMQNDWVVCVKAQTIFHHIFRDGNEKFVEYIAAHARSVFRMEFFAEATSDGFAHASFIKTYGAYLEQWLAMKAAIRFPAGKAKEDDPANTTRYRDAKIETLLAALPVMMDTLDGLFAIDLSGQIKFSPVATPAFSMILRDLTLLWVSLSEGMIRLLDLYFSLQIPLATIAFDVYKRFVETVTKAQPFFEVARTLNVKWQTPTLGAISLDLLDSMQKYLSIGPEDPNARKQDDYSDEEVYEPEPVQAPPPDLYYAPEPEFYSSSDEEIEEREPSPLPSSSSESSSSEEEESSSSEEEEEPFVAPPPPPPAPKKFDPLADLLGITEGVGGGTANGNGNTNGQLTLYQGGPAGMMQRATLEQTADDRVANVKGMMAAVPQQAGGARSGFGVDGTNMQLALYGQQQGVANPQQQQQMMAAMQQQQMAAYQTMAAYQSMAMYQSMAAGMNPMMMQQQQQQQFAMAQAQAQRGGNLMPSAQYVPTPQGANTAVPAMQAQAAAYATNNYRVQKNTEKTRVSSSDAAFGPLLDQMKNAPGVGK